VLNESRQHFFDTRLWDARDVIDQLLEHYDQMPAEVQTELPLKRAWILVQEE